MKKLTHRLFGGPCGLGALGPGPPGPLDKTALDETAFHNATQTYKTKTKTTACKTKTKTNFFSSQTGLILWPTVSDHITARCCLWPVGLGLGLRKANVPWNSVVLVSDFADWNIENSERGSCPLNGFCRWCGLGCPYIPVDPNSF